MYVRVSCWVALALSVWGKPGNAEILQPVSDVRENYVKTKVYCADPIELRRTPPAPFASFDDSTTSYLTMCEPLAIAWASAIQQSSIRGDSIWVYEEFFSNSSIEATSVTRSDATITFRIDAGQQSQCFYRVDLSGAQDGGGTGFLRSSLTKVAASGTTVLASVNRDLGPLPNSVGTRLDRLVTLHAGDYVLDVHAYGEQGDRVYGSILTQLKLYNLTSIAPMRWGRVKLLYR